MTTPTLDSTPTIDNSAAAPDAPAVALVETSRVLGITSLALGIASIVFGYTVFVPIAAIVIGAIGLGREPAGRNYSAWGIVIGAVSLALPLIALLFGIALLAPFGVFALFFG